MDQPVRNIGHYILEHEIARGGMSIVHRAHDSRNNRPVALKVLPPEFAYNSTYLNRFLREGENAQRLRHPNIVQTYDAGQADGSNYIAMELADAGTLGDRLKRSPRPLSLEETLHILTEVAAGLDYAHSLNFLHRDIKPSNIMFAADGRILIADFGVAKDLASDETMMTMPGFSVGTPAYMSPEQALGDANVDRRSDVYSLGVVAYAMLTGKMPFEAESHLVLLRKIVDEPPVPPEKANPRIHPGASSVLKRVLSKNPAERYATAGDFVAALRERTGAPPKMQQAKKPSTPIGNVSARDASAHDSQGPNPEPNPRIRQKTWTDQFEFRKRSRLWAIALVVVILLGSAGVAWQSGWISSRAQPIPDENAQSAPPDASGQLPPAATPTNEDSGDNENSQTIVMATTTATPTPTASPSHSPSPTATPTQTTAPTTLSSPTSSPSHTPTVAATPTADPVVVTQIAITPIATPVVLRRYSDTDARFIVTLPRGWVRSESGAKTTFRSEDDSAQFFVHWLGEDAVGITSPASLLQAYDLSGELAVQDLQNADSGRQHSLAGYDAYEQRYTGTDSGAPVSVRLIAVAEDDIYLVVGSIVRADREIELNVWLDGAFADFELMPF